MPVTANAAPLRLCCLLWARPGRREALRDYESAVIALLGDHGGVCETRVGSTSRPPDAADDPDRAEPPHEGRHPDEVQVYRFPDRSALESYLADPRRTALTGRRDAAVARTELFEVTDPSEVTELFEVTDPSVGPPPAR